MPKEVKGKINDAPKKKRTKPSAPLIAKKTDVAPKAVVQKKTPATEPVVPARVKNVIAPMPSPARAVPAKKAPPSAPRPRRQIQPAPAAPRPLTTAEKNRTAVVFAFGVMAAAVIIFFAVRYQTARPLNGAATTGVAAMDQTLADVEAKSDFQTWLAKWQSVDPYVNQHEFTLESSGAIAIAGAPDSSATPDAATLQPPLANRYVWSPDKTKFLDYLASYGEPDSTITAYNRDGRGVVETLATCGTPCRFSGAFWLDASRVVVLGSAEDVKDDGTPLCIRNQGSVGDTSERCYRHLTVTAYDFAASTQRTYRSDKHAFTTDPTDADMRARWISGLSDADRAAMSAGETAVVLRGAIVSVAADSGIIGVSDQNLGMRMAVMSPSATVRDMQGNAIGLADIVIGSQAEAVTAQDDKGELTALSVRVLSVPPVTFTIPKEGAIVHRRFTVRGTATTDSVTLRVTDERLQQAIITVDVRPDAANGGAFSTVIDLHSHGVATGDTLHIDAVPDPNVTGGAQTIGVNVQYRP